MFRVEGMFRMGERWQKFAKEIDAGSEEEAVEKTYSLLGSNHKVKRVHVKIGKVMRVE